MIRCCWLDVLTGFTSHIISNLLLADLESWGDNYIDIFPFFSCCNDSCLDGLMQFSGYSEMKGLSRRGCSRLNSCDDQDKAAILVSRVGKCFLTDKIFFTQKTPPKIA